MNILIAPNAFKQSLSATEAAAAIAAGLLESKLNCEVTQFPVGYGGDGTGHLLVEHFHGTDIPAAAHDALGRTIMSSFGLSHDGKTAVIEMAKASGLALLKTNELDPLRANSFGTGELITQALNRNVQHLAICVGGSATTDGGAGMLEALGARFLGAGGELLSGSPCDMQNLGSIDLSRLDKRLRSCKIIVLCDVRNPLLGEDGAASVFAPQKGAGPSDVIRLQASLTHFRDIIREQMNVDVGTAIHGGAAGGAAAGLAAIAGAELNEGIDYFLSITGFHEALSHADLVITGEGKIDMQTFAGKAPFGVATKANDAGVPVLALAGTIGDDATAMCKHYFTGSFSISDGATSLHQALLDTVKNLRRTAAQIGNLVAKGKILIK
jgi:glycerate 2-kinase